MKIWTWLQPTETPNREVLRILVGDQHTLIKFDENNSLGDITKWLCSSCESPVMVAPLFGNPMEIYEPYYIYYIYFGSESEACHFRLRWL